MSFVSYFNEQGEVVPHEVAELLARYGDEYYGVAMEAFHAVWGRTGDRGEGARAAQEAIEEAWSAAPRPQASNGGGRRVRVNDSSDEPDRQARRRAEHRPPEEGEWVEVEARVPRSEALDALRRHYPPQPTHRTYRAPDGSSVGNRPLPGLGLPSDGSQRVRVFSGDDPDRDSVLARSQQFDDLVDAVLTGNPTLTRLQAWDQAREGDSDEKRRYAAVVPSSRPVVRAFSFHDACDYPLGVSMEVERRTVARMSHTGESREVAWRRVLDDDPDLKMRYVGM